MAIYINKNFLSLEFSFSKVTLNYFKVFFHTLINTLWSTCNAKSIACSFMHDYSIYIEAICFFIFWFTKFDSFSFSRLLQEREIIVYCDLHGHSRKQNVFIYGCENRHNPEKRLKERVFPLMLNKNAPDKVRSSDKILELQLKYQLNYNLNIS